MLHTPSLYNKKKKHNLLKFELKLKQTRDGVFIAENCLKNKKKNLHLRGCINMRALEIVYYIYIYLYVHAQTLNNNAHTSCRGVFVSGITSVTFYL